MLTVLGFDCAGGSCSAAVLVDGQVAACRDEPMARGHAEALLPMIDAALAAARVDVAALDLVAVTVGPGSFTGIRIGLATARGLALAGRLPLVGTTCFEAAAAAVSEDARESPLVVALESKRDELFLQRFEHGAPSEPGLISPRRWADFAPPGPFVLAGDGAERFAAGLARPDVSIVRLAPGAMAISAARRGAARRERDAGLSPPSPLYLRAPDVTLPGADGKKLP